MKESLFSSIQLFRTVKMPPKQKPRQKPKQPLPGTPQRVRVSSRSDCHTCATCLHPIVEATGDEEGQEAIFCEGSCNTWYHRWCAGVSSQRYEVLSSSEEPFHCPSCTADKQQQSILELQTRVQSLLEEVCKLEATVTALQEKSVENNHSLLKEVRDLKDIVAALQETNADTSTCASPESYIENGHSKDTQSWSEVVRRKPSEMGKRKGGKDKGSKRGRGGSEQGQRVQPNVQSSPKQRASSQGQHSRSANGKVT